MDKKNINKKFKIFNLKNLYREVEKHQKKLSSQCYIENDCIILNVCYIYEIEISRCNTKDKLLHWVHHLLTTKSWINIELLIFFIELVAKHCNLDIYKSY